MSKNKSSLEGYLMIDNRASHGGMLEMSTLTCSHCQNQVVLNPARQRARNYCPKCDRFICDECELHRSISGICRPYTQVLDMAEDMVTKGKTISNPQTLIARLS